MKRRLIGLHVAFAPSGEDMEPLNQLSATDAFIQRHIGPNEDDRSAMLAQCNASSIDQLIEETVPAQILLKNALNLSAPQNEYAALASIKALAQQNIVNKSYIGMGYYPVETPTVILRNILENPGWYTAYTPYQPEIAQGRLEAIINFQQMVIDFTAMELANASLLDEGTAAAEAMAMSQRCVKKNKSLSYFVDQHVHPQTIAVLKTRAANFGFELIIGDIHTELEQEDVFGVLLQYPNTLGHIQDPSHIIELAHDKKAIVTVATDLMALAMLTPPGELGADIVIGNSQHFGVPMGFGGPHAAFFACKESYKRSLPGRIIGVSKDSQGHMAYRMAMQTREQHIRREKATSNICTSQALLAIMASFYAVYHGATGIKQIAMRTHSLTSLLSDALSNAGLTVVNKDNAFDTLHIQTSQAQTYYNTALEAGINLRFIDQNNLTLSLSECDQLTDIQTLASIFNATLIADEHTTAQCIVPEVLVRTSSYLSHPVFNRYHSETDILRYMKRLENKDMTLTHSMIPLGSCTMKLNATAEMIPVTWPEFANIHPFAPQAQTQGYQTLLNELEEMLEVCTGYDAISLQPNAGSQGEYAGLLAIKAYHQANGDHERHICLIPSSAHGTNPASAAMVNMDVVIIKCDDKGNVDLKDLDEKITQYSKEISCLMITYPSTHGVFEESISQICEKVHSVGGQVYVDGANMNALVGVAAPGKFGADVSHLNLHKTFAIPHGGGGPGMGPIGVKSHLAKFLPGNPLAPGQQDVVASAQYGSAGVLPISYMYIKMMGDTGMRQATENAILNANYIASRLQHLFPILYTGANGRVAHECILDIRPLKEGSGISEEDIAKRLMDYGFHAPTMSFPVPGTLMVEPTESESKFELDRFCEAMTAIYKEIMQVQEGTWPLDNNPLVNAPHTHHALLKENWDHPYSRETAAYPVESTRFNKIWPSAARIDNVYGDRNLFCACPAIETYE